MPGSMEPLETRLDDLEVKASFTEDALDSLNAVVIRQQKQIQALISEVAELRRLQATAENSQGANPAHDQPPHY
ncbi:MAG: SlyX family protein [Burkholderiaceae bacterium]